jgi:acid phosphatase family membrane protein YuiD
MLQLASVIIYWRTLGIRHKASRHFHIINFLEKKKEKKKKEIKGKKEESLIDKNIYYILKSFYVNVLDLNNCLKQS